MWGLPWPRVKPVFPALAGGFLSTVPPGKSLPVLPWLGELCHWDWDLEVWDWEVWVPKVCFFFSQHWFDYYSSRELSCEFQGQLISLLEETSWNFDRDYTESEDPFGESCHLNISSPWTQDFFHLLRSSGISFSIVCNFQSTLFFPTSLIKVILRRFVLLGTIVNRMIVFHFWTAHCKCIEIQVILYIDLVSCNLQNLFIRIIFCGFKRFSIYKRTALVSRVFPSSFTALMPSASFSCLSSWLVCAAQSCLTLQPRGL